MGAFAILNSSTRMRLAAAWVRHTVSQIVR
jgi:hypothetical protein